MQITKTTNKPPLTDGSVLYVDDTPYRIISRIKQRDDTWVYYLLRLDITTMAIEAYSLNTLLEGIQKGTVVSGDVQYETIPKLEEGAKTVLDYRYRKVKDYVDSLYPHYMLLQRRGYEKKKLNELADALGKKPRWARALVLRYMQYGGNIVALVDQRWFRATNPESTVPGRKAEGQSSSVVFDAVLDSYFEAAYREFRATVNSLQYGENTKSKPTLKGAYNNMIIKHYMPIDDQGVPRLLPESQRPSYGRFLRWVRNQKNNGNNLWQLKASLMDARNNARLLVGDSSFGCTRPCQIVELDEHEVPLVTVSDYIEGLQVTGKAIMHIGIDALTRTIIGMHVIVKVNNSYEGFLNFFDSMLMNDAENAFMNGVTQKNHQVFPGPCIPEMIRVDHGSQYISKAMRENLTGGCDGVTLQGLPIAIELAPPGTGSMKGLVEGFFGVFDQRIQDALHSKYGFVSKAKKSKHYKDAVLTIANVRQIAYEVVDYYNNRELEKKNYTPPEEILSAVPVRSPLKLWEYYTMHYGLAFDVTSDAMRNTARLGVMLKNRTFKVSRKQISYRDFLYYDITEDAALCAMATASKNASKKIEVRYDPRTVDRLYRIGDDGETYVYPLAKARNSMRSYEGKSWYYVDAVCDKETDEDRQRRKRNADKRIELKSNVQMIAKNAEENARTLGEANQKNISEAGTVERVITTTVDSRKRDYIFGETKQPVLLLPEEQQPEEVIPEEIEETEELHDDPSDLSMDSILALFGYSNTNE